MKEYYPPALKQIVARCTPPSLFPAAHSLVQIPFRRNHNAQPNVSLIYGIINDFTLDFIIQTNLIRKTVLNQVV